MSHALLSPSSASRWLECTPSAKLESDMPYTTSSYADEGTLAHKLGELLIRYKLGLTLSKPFKAELKKIEQEQYYSLDMYDHCDDYAAFVMERYTEAISHTKDAMIFLEQRLDLTAYVPEGFGTGDVVIIADGVMDIIDLKYGKGVPVSAEKNKQLMLYALGGLDMYDHLYGISIARVTIFQPRLDSISTWETAVPALKIWAVEVLKVRAAMAFNGEGEFSPGDHCRFCKVKASCAANARYQLELARHEFKEPALLTPEEVSAILKRVDTFTNWIAAVEEYALDRAVNGGVAWPGFKVVEGRSNRKYTDEPKIAETLKAKDFTDDQIYNKKLLGLTEMTKLLGTTDFNKLLSPYIGKPPGKPVLVPETDKRPALNSVDSAKSDFADV